MPWEEANGLLPGRPAPGRGPGRAPGLGAAGVGRSAAGVVSAAGVSGAAGAEGAGGACSGSGAFGVGAGAEGAASPGAAGAAAGFGSPLEGFFGAAGFFFAAGSAGASCSGFAGNASRRRRCTGGSMVDDADFTNSPSSFSFAITVLLSSPSSFASSWTRTFATTLLSRPICEAGRTVLVVRVHRRVLIGCPSASDPLSCSMTNGSCVMF